MSIEHVDVLIVGAGLSGVGAACHLKAECPTKSWTILEARDRIGGTWDLFRYPGIRSDSDMYTLGYSFKPWRESKSIADGASILDYIRQTAREHGIEEKVRFGHRAVRAEWSSDQARWTVEVQREGADSVLLSCDLLFMCSGYYRYDEGYTPELPGTERFAGRIVHPQHWSEDVEYANKRVVVIGSGATAITLVPAMAERAAHVTMLQRSPSYVVSLPSEDPLARLLRRHLPARFAYPVIRWKNVALTMASFQLSRRRPSLIKRLIRKRLESLLPAGYDIDTHFTPSYDPWDQRLCLVPNGDLFEAIGAGRASVVTDRIDTFTETGIELASGAKLEADVIVTATGLNMLALGGLELEVDGREVVLGETMAYKGMMLSDVPNMVFAVGYANASWTLKCDLTCKYLCRLLNHMDAHGLDVCLPKRDSSVDERPFIDFSSGYVLRAVEKFPKQGTTAPWRLYQNYPRDILALKFGSLEDTAMEFSRAPAPRAAQQQHQPVTA